jgi:ribulose-5-phosphate 4-epimerase/fuculose-1-phosphate aldolase
MMSDDAISNGRDALANGGRALAARGLAPGSSGNLSLLLDDGTMLVTPTDSSLGVLAPENIARIATDGSWIEGGKPSKEALLHLAIYAARPSARAVVHLHSTYCAAVSCMEGLPADNCLPPLTPYFVMKAGRLPLIPYHRPGDPALAARIGAVASDHPALLLANHGPIAAGRTLDAAIALAEELEETAKLFLLLHGQPTRTLTPTQIDELNATFGDANGR